MTGQQRADVAATRRVMTVATELHNVNTARQLTAARIWADVQPGTAASVVALHVLASMDTYRRKLRGLLQDALEALSP